MSRYVAFLRGINLGGRRVKMDDLRSAVAELELDGVDTFLASGNVIFRDPADAPGKVERRLEDHLEGALGFATEALVRSLDELERLSRADAVAAGETAGLKPYVVFLRDEAGEGVEEALRALETSDDRFHLLGRNVVWLRRGGIGKTSISARDFEAAVGGMSHTRRNLNTVRRILAKYGE